MREHNFRPRNFSVKRKVRLQQLSPQRKSSSNSVTKYDENHLRPLRLSIAILPEFLYVQKVAGETVVECHTF